MIHTRQQDETKFLRNTSVIAIYKMQTIINCREIMDRGPSRFTELRGLLMVRKSVRKCDWPMFFTILTFRRSSALNQRSIPAPLVHISPQITSHFSGRQWGTLGGLRSFSFFANSPKLRVIFMFSPLLDTLDPRSTEGL